MKNIATYLIAALLCASVHAAEQPQTPQAEDYTLSMAGALINDWCQRQWQQSNYVNVHGCNYHLAQQYTLEISAAQFEQCAILSRGDIVQIADCMVEQFGSWRQVNLTTTP